MSDVNIGVSIEGRPERGVQKKGVARAISFVSTSWARKETAGVCVLAAKLMAEDGQSLRRKTRHVALFPE